MEVAVVGLLILITVFAGYTALFAGRALDYLKDIRDKLDDIEREL